MNARVFSSLLRMATLATRFAFVFFLAKFLTPADVGLYGLFTAAIGYSIYFVGIEFYTYSTREIVGAQPEIIARAIKNHIALSTLLYAIVTPLVLIALAVVTNWPTYAIWLFVPILFCEHFNQEIYRLLISQFQPVAASLLLFLRQASWAIVIIAIAHFVKAARNLELFLIVWLISGLTTVFFGLLKLKKMGGLDWSYSIDWKWIRQGVRISKIFLLATLAIRGIQTFDRYALEAIGGIEAVGAYVIFSGVASSLAAFLDAGVFSFTYPLLLKHAKNSEFSLFFTQIRNMAFVVICSSVVFSIIAYLTMPLLLIWINKNLYQEHISIFYWTVAAFVAYALSQIPHFALYALKMDKEIMKTQIFSFLIFITSCFLLGQSGDATAVPQSVFLSFLALLIYKAYYLIAWKHAKNNYSTI